MFTSWEQVESWIKDNGFKRWILYKDATRTDKIIDSAAFTVSDQADKIAMTEKYLRMTGGRAFGAGFANNGTTDATVCEIRLETEAPAGAQAVAGYSSIGELEETLMKKLRAEMKAEQYERERAQFEKERKEFDEEKKSALGALVHYFAPIGQQLLQNKMMRNVAGMDSDRPVDIVVHHDVPAATQTEETEAEEVETSPWDVFTDEEGEKLGALLARFKKVEPRYLELIESVVTMAENGDGTYNMAKGFLLK